MKINKDLADAVMMLSFIILVLAGTTDFEDGTMKTIIMGVLAVLALAMAGARFLASKNNGEQQTN